MTAPAEPGRGRGAARSQATRTSLIELAAELFAERGYVQTSIRDITRRGDVTSGAIYGHFRNKADLLAEARLGASRLCHMTSLVRRNPKAV